MASSSRSWRYDVFPSFRGEDVRKSFLSYLLKEFDRKSITTFADHGIMRSHPISQELLFAIRESRISVVVFSKNYASSTWCLNELVEIHNCYMEFGQLVVPVFYDVDPSDVRKQTGDFGKTFIETCRNKTDDEIQRWIRALVEVANLAGEDLRNWDNEANMVEKIANDVSNKLITPSNSFADYVGIEGHIEAMNSILCMESGGVRMVGIVGPSGIGKTVIARALFNKLSSQFHHRVFLNDYRRTNGDEYDTKLCWEQRFLSEILCQKDLNINCFGMIEQRLKNRKVLIVLNYVDNVELLTTLVGQTAWFGSGSRIIVITQDKQLLRAHKIEYVYEVDFPSEDLALQMLCRRAFGQNSPLDGFTELAVEVANLAGKLPLGLSVLGSSLKGKDKKEWIDMLPRFRKGLDGNIVKTLRVSYDGLHDEDQNVFLYIACLFNRQEVGYITSLLGVSVNIGLKMLANKSLIRITPHNIVEMHNLLKILGRDVVRGESKNPGKRRFLVDAEDIREVLKRNTGTKNVLAIDFIPSKIVKPFTIDENSFERMHNLRFLKFYPGWSMETGEVLSYLPQGLVSLPRKLRLLNWSNYPLKYIPPNFCGKYLVVLEMTSSKLEKLWEGIQPLGSLKKMNLAFSTDLKEIPDLSNAINLEQLILWRCLSLESLPSSIQNLNKLMELDMRGCSKLEVLPTGFNLQSLYYLNLNGCSRLRSFPQISMNIETLFLNDTEIEEDCFWIENIYGLAKLYWNGCLMRCMPSNFPTEYLVELKVENSELEKLWEGDKGLGSLRRLDLSGSENLKEIPDLSHAPNLQYLVLIGCNSLVMLPSSIRNLHEMMDLNMSGCSRLEVLPTDVNLESLEFLTLSECSRLRFFPKISTRIQYLDLSHTAIQEVPCWIKDISELAVLSMSGCKRLETISPNILKLNSLHMVDFSDCEGLLPMAEKATFPRTELHTKCCESLQGTPHSSHNPMTCLEDQNCFNLDIDARRSILQLNNEYSLLPGGEVPTYFTHRASGSSLVFPLHKSSLSKEFLGFKACILLESLTSCCHYTPDIEVRWYFRATTGMFYVDAYMDSCKMDKLALFQIWLPTKNINDPPAELDYNYLEFHFYYRSNRYFHECGMDNCPCSTQRIKGCGVRIWDVPPYPDVNDRSSEQSPCDVEWKDMNIG